MPTIPLQVQIQSSSPRDRVLATLSCKYNDYHTVIAALTYPFPYTSSFIHTVHIPANEEETYEVRFWNVYGIALPIGVTVTVTVRDRVIGKFAYVEEGQERFPLCMSLFLLID